MLSRHSSMGSSLASAKDFLEVHEQLDEDIRVSALENEMRKQLDKHIRIYALENLKYMSN